MKATGLFARLSNADLCRVASLARRTLQAAQAANRNSGQLAGIIAQVLQDEEELFAEILARLVPPAEDDAAFARKHAPCPGPLHCAECAVVRLDKITR